MVNFTIFYSKNLISTYRANRIALEHLLSNTLIKTARHIHLIRIYAIINDANHFCDSATNASSRICSNINIFTIFCIVFFHIKNTVPNSISML